MYFKFYNYYNKTLVNNIIRQAKKIKCKRPTYEVKRIKFSK